MGNLCQSNFNSFSMLCLVMRFWPASLRTNNYNGFNNCSKRYKLFVLVSLRNSRWLNARCITLHRPLHASKRPLM